MGKCEVCSNDGIESSLINKGVTKRYGFSSLCRECYKAVLRIDEKVALIDFKLSEFRDIFTIFYVRKINRFYGSYRSNNTYCCCGGEVVLLHNTAHEKSVYLCYACYNSVRTYSYLNFHHQVKINHKGFTSYLFSLFLRGLWRNYEDTTDNK